MKRTQFVLDGEHPLLLLVRDHLIKSGFELVAEDGIDVSRPVFVVFGAEVKTLEASTKLNSKLRLLQSAFPTLLLSSSSVYGDRDFGLELRPVRFMDEAHAHVITSSLDPSAIRPLTALTAEYAAVQRSEGRTIVVRPFNVYGPNVRSGVIHAFISQLGGTLSVHTPGRMLRTFLYEEDFLRAIDLCVGKLLRGGRGIYNVGSSELVEILSLAKSVCHAFDQKAKIELVECHDRHVWWKNPSLERIKADFKFKPTVSLRSGLFRMAGR